MPAINVPVCLRRNIQQKNRKLNKQQKWQQQYWYSRPGQLFGQKILPNKTNNQISKVGLINNSQQEFPTCQSNNRQQKQT